MLVISRQIDEQIKLGDDITLIIVDIRGDKVRLGIDAPKDLPIHRQEVYDAIKKAQSQNPVPAPTIPIRKSVDMKDRVVTYDDTPEAREKVFQMLLEWYHHHGVYDGESINQCDAPQIDGPQLLARIAEKALKLDVTCRPRPYRTRTTEI